MTNRLQYGPVKDYGDFPNGVTRVALIDKIKAFVYGYDMQEPTHGEMTARQFADLKRWVDYPDIVFPPGSSPPFEFGVIWTSVTADRFRLFRADDETGGRSSTCDLCYGPNPRTHRDVCDDCYWNLVAEEAANEANGGNDSDG